MFKPIGNARKSLNGTGNKKKVSAFSLYTGRQKLYSALIFLIGIFFSYLLFTEAKKDSEYIGYNHFKIH